VPVEKELFLFGNQIGIVLECIFIDKCKMLVKRVSFNAIHKPPTTIEPFQFSPEKLMAYEWDYLRKNSSDSPSIF
jgi:hypothetical protein